MKTLQEYITLSAKFIDHINKRPLSGDYITKLYDKDVFDNDFLGESRLDHRGRAQIKFRMDQIRSVDSHLAFTTEGGKLGLTSVLSNFIS